MMRKGDLGCGPEGRRVGVSHPLPRASGLSATRRWSPRTGLTVWPQRPHARVAAATIRLESRPSSWPRSRTTAGVADTQQYRGQPPGQGAAEDAVQVIQPIAQDRRPDPNRQDRQTDPTSQPSSTWLPVSACSASTVTAAATGTAATSSHRSCWRSTPPARRMRTTSDQAPSGIESPATATPPSPGAGDRGGDQAAPAPQVLAEQQMGGWPATTGR